MYQLRTCNYHANGMGYGDVQVLAPACWVAGSTVAVATVGAGLAGSEVGTLTD